LDEAGDQVLWPKRRLAAAAPFRDQDVAIGEDERLAGDSEAGGDGGDRIAGRDGGTRIAPGRGVGDLHAGDEAALLLGKLRVGAELVGIGAIVAAASA